MKHIFNILKQVYERFQVSVFLLQAGRQNLYHWINMNSQQNIKIIVIMWPLSNL